MNKRKPQPTDSAIRPHDWLSPSVRGTTHLPDALRWELSNPEHIPWIPDANLVVLYNPDITLEEFEMGLEIMKMDIRLRHRGKSEDEISSVLHDLRTLLRKRDYKSLSTILKQMKDDESTVPGDNDV